MLHCDIATVVSVSRRYVSLLDGSGEFLKGTIASSAMHLVIGDLVRFTKKSDSILVTEVQDSQHNLYRSHRNSRKKMGANIDHLFVISAIGAVFNSESIDRMLLAAAVEEIPATILMNKMDLGENEVKGFIEEYRDLGWKCELISAKFDKNLEALSEILSNPKLRIIALTGVSGVGKSRLLNKLVPDASSAIGEVSPKTGQGRQTTTQPHAYVYNRNNSEDLLIIDYPGVQNFGLSHIDKELVNLGFPEIEKFRLNCQFMDCSHFKEQNCAVKDALQSGAIKEWRFNSYLRILKEIEDNKPY